MINERVEDFPEVYFVHAAHEYLAPIGANLANVTFIHGIPTAISQLDEMPVIQAAIKNPKSISMA